MRPTKRSLEKRLEEIGNSDEDDEVLSQLSEVGWDLVYGHEPVPDGEVVWETETFRVFDVPDRTEDADDE